MAITIPLICCVDQAVDDPGGGRKRAGTVAVTTLIIVTHSSEGMFTRFHKRKCQEIIAKSRMAVSGPFALRRAGVPSEKHKTIRHKNHIYVEDTIHTNTVESAFSLLKRGIIGTWHRVSAKHLPACLNEMCFRFNNRKNDFLFRDTMLRLISSTNLEYKSLTATKNAA
jgi:hypothetical protein